MPDSSGDRARARWIRRAGQSEGRRSWQPGAEHRPLGDVAIEQCQQRADPPKVDVKIAFEEVLMVRDAVAQQPDLFEFGVYLCAGRSRAKRSMKGRTPQTSVI